MLPLVHARGFEFAGNTVQRRMNSQISCCTREAAVPGYRFRVPGSIPGATRFSDK
jgi:hypothetical protein